MPSASGSKYLEVDTMSIPVWRPFEDIATILPWLSSGTEISRKRYHYRRCLCLSDIDTSSKQHQGLCNIRRLRRAGRCIHAVAPQHIRHLAPILTATYQQRRLRAVSHGQKCRPDGDFRRRVDTSHHEMMLPVADDLPWHTSLRYAAVS